MEFSAPKKYFIPWSIFGLIMAVGMQIAFLAGLGYYDLKVANYEMLESLMNPALGCWYAAFIQNLIMSFLYIAMFIKSKGDKGQSMTIAVSKCIGTLAPTILYGGIMWDKVVLATGIFTFLLDLTYIWMLTQKEAFFKANITRG